MSCPKCGRQVEDDAVICPGCDFILDSSFLGDDITNTPGGDREASVVEENPLLSSAGYGQDDLILGDGVDDFEAFESQNTGLAKEVTHARIFVGGAASELLRPDAIPGIRSGVDPEELKLSPFERHILSLCNGYRPVGRIRKKSGISDAEVHTSLAMLHDKSVIELTGHVSEARKERARQRRRKRKRKEHEEKKRSAPSPQTPSPPVPAQTAPSQKGAPQRDGDASQVEPTVVSIPPSAPVDDVKSDVLDDNGADRRVDEDSAGEHEHRIRTGDVDLDALAADAAADISASDPEDLLALAFSDDGEPKEMNERELLLSVAEGAVSEVAEASRSEAAAQQKDDLDLLASDAFAADAFDAFGETPRGGGGEQSFGEVLSSVSDIVNEGRESLGDVDGGPNVQEDRVLRALADDADRANDPEDFLGSDEATGAKEFAESLDVGSIEVASADLASDVAPAADLASDVAPAANASADFASADFASVDFASAAFVSAEGLSVEAPSVDVAIEWASVEGTPAVSGPPPPPDESIPSGFSLEEDPDLAAALLDSEEGNAVVDEPASVIRPAASVAPAMAMRRGSPSTAGRSITVAEPGLSSTIAPSLSPRLPGQGAPSAQGDGGIPSLPGQGSASASMLSTSGVDVEGISLEGFSLEDSSEEEIPAPAGLTAAAPVTAPPVAAVSFEMQRKARLIFEQAQKDMMEGRPSSALMNAKLACIYDPAEVEFQTALSAWQNQDPSDAPKAKELILFEEAKEAELAGEYDYAVELLEKALSSNPRAAPLHNRLGVILATRLKKYAPASQALLRACELDSGNLAYKNNLGKILVMEEKEADERRTKKGFAERLLGGPDDASVRVRTIRPKQY